jgi:acetoin utilization deacetylase AcuC-like enzyme
MELSVFYNNDYTASPESFETTRKSAQVVKSIIDSKDGRINIVDPSFVIPRSTVEEIIETIHTEEYVRALKKGTPNHLASSSGFEWGESTYDFAVAHSHGVVASVASVIAGQMRAGTLSSGLHHASPSNGAGFCTVNGLAVGSLYAISEGYRVLILDFDAHCGGGTMEHILRMTRERKISRGQIVQVDLSTSGFDSYDEETPHYMRTPIITEDNPDDDYIKWITDALVAAESRYDEDMVVIYNAGIDPINVVDFEDPLGVLERREALVSSWIGDKPAVFTLAGGYKWGGFTMEDIAEGHMKNIRQWADHLSKVRA